MRRLIKLEKGCEMAKVKEVEIPRYATPGYLEKLLLTNLDDTPPGHRFLLYFHGTSYKIRLTGENREVKRKGEKVEQKLVNGEWKDLYRKHPPRDWNPLRDTKIYALKSVAAKSGVARVLTEALRLRQASLAERFAEQVESIPAKLTAPLATGLGNPHPVENGFSFLSPYGVPYLPGSGIKGVVRRAAEELALFDESSDWTIPLVWLLFGFEASSAYIAPPSKFEAVDVVQKEAEHWRRAFREYAESQAKDDEVLSCWFSLEAVKSSIPEEMRDLAKRPAEFCKLLQVSDRLRKAISWQGFLRFWDAFFSEGSLKVDILNPHHRNYYEGKGTPNDAESPKPVFFLTVSEGAEFMLYVQMVPRNGVNLPCENWRKLVREAMEYACGWVGFGAKTAVGYGIGGVKGGGGKVKKGAKERGREEGRKEEGPKGPDPEKLLEGFKLRVDRCQNLPGEIKELIQSVNRQEDPGIRREMCSILLEKANSLRKKRKFSRALKDNKPWAIQLKELLEENGVMFQEE